MHKRIILGVILSIWFLTACGTSTSTTSQIQIGHPVNVPQSGSYTEISVTELKTMFDQDDIVLVNVHVPYEGDIPGTDLSIPYDQINILQEQLPSDKNQKIVLYCRSGHMSGIAAKAMVQLGYSNVYDLSGGFNAWIQAGQSMNNR